jgi:hypothetical protein
LYPLPTPLFKEKKAELNQLLSKLSDKFDKKLAETDRILIPDRKVLTFQFSLLKVRSTKYVVHYMINNVYFVTVFPQIVSSLK